MCKAWMMPEGSTEPPSAPHWPQKGLGPASKRWQCCKPASDEWFGFQENDHILCENGEISIENLAVKVICLKLKHVVPCMPCFEVVPHCDLLLSPPETPESVCG